MRSGEKTRRDTLSMLRAAIKNEEINARGRDNAGEGNAPLDDATVQRVIEREAKKRRDAIDEYEKAGRADRAEAERTELQVLQEFLPEQLTEEELESLARAAIEQSGAKAMSDMGKVMPLLMPQIAGRADGKQASAIVRRLLS